MTSRRGLLLCLGVGSLTPALVIAQPSSRKHRLCVLGTSAAALREAHWLAFLQHLGELGLVEGRNLVIETRHSGNRPERAHASAAELADFKCDVFFSGGTEANLAALRVASGGKPIVFIAVDFDPVAAGDVSGLARPGGLVTGVTAVQSTMPAKRLELLREMLPSIGTVAVFTNEQTAEQLAVVRDASRRLGLTLHVVDFKAPPFDYQAGFASAVRAKAGALFVLGSGLWVPARRTIVDLASKARLPSVFHHSGWVEAGGMMSYGFSFPGMWRRGAEMVASILRGRKIGDLPMEQPTTFDLAINLKTAKLLGVDIPPSFLLRADRVFE